MKRSAERSSVWAERGRLQAQRCVHEQACPYEEVQHTFTGKTLIKKDTVKKQHAKPTENSLQDSLIWRYGIIWHEYLTWNNSYRSEKTEKYNSSPLMCCHCRCISPELKSLALGIQVLVTRTLGEFHSFQSHVRKSFRTFWFVAFVCSFKCWHSFSKVPKTKAPFCGKS